MLPGIVLGIISWLSIMLSWWHLPEAIKNFTRKHPVLSDIAAGLLTFGLLSGISKSLVAVIGSVVTTLLINLSIMIGYYLTHSQTNTAGHNERT